MSTEQLLDEVMHLPHAARALMAERLLASLDEEKEEISPAWRAEVRERETRYNAGKTQSVAAAEVHQRIESLLEEPVMFQPMRQARKASSNTTGNNGRGKACGTKK